MPFGFIRAFTGALGGTFADQWKEFFQPNQNVPATAAISEAVSTGTNAGRGGNKRGSENVITNGSRFIVPEGMALITFENGAVTGFISEPGGYTYSSNAQDSKSIFSGGGFISSTIKTSWERFKFGGIPSTQQIAFYVNLREIPNNRFGTQSEIYWDDAFLGTQVGAIARGSYTMRITDPILFAKQFVPAQYLQPHAPIFDFADMNNDAGSQLFSEIVGSLAAAFSHYANDPQKGNRMARIQGDALGFAQSLSAVIEEKFQWREGRGLEIQRVVIEAIEYDADTKALLSDVRKADALSGGRGNSFMQQSVARGMQAAGENPSGVAAGMAFMGMGMNAAGGIMGSMQQQPTQPAQPQQPAQADPVERLKQMKELLDAGILSQSEFDTAREKILGGMGLL
ncbi:MAG: SPFH domain-containing protein [Defluviitaleaceae bacterium]|nr:SPFH domain-containing protein [Defluviitaleaceae bacterium]